MPEGLNQKENQSNFAFLRPLQIGTTAAFERYENNSIPFFSAYECIDDNNLCLRSGLRRYP
jgi:hypothetical protein